MIIFLVSGLKKKGAAAFLGAFSETLLYSGYPPTLLLAYSGGFTTMLMVFLAQGTPLVAIFNLTDASTEILHTLVGSFGLVLVAPLTAIIAGVIYFKTGKRAFYWYSEEKGEAEQEEEEESKVKVALPE